MKMYFLVFLFFLYHCTVVTEIIATEAVVNKNKSLLVDSKCSKCHTIKRVFIHARTEEEWNSVIDKMMSKVPGWISTGRCEADFYRNYYSLAGTCTGNECGKRGFC